MLRIPLLLSVWCLALALPAVAGTDVTNPADHTASPSSAVSTPIPTDLPACEANASEPDDLQYVWRLRAFRHLDCVTGMVEEAMNRVRDDDAGGSNDNSDEPVRLSRKELERIHMLVLLARDAAARIGR